MKCFDLSSRKMEHVCWLWSQYIPLEEVTIIQGDPGLGKGHIAADLVARFTTGRPMPGDAPTATKPGRVLWLTTEDDPARVLKPRLIAAGANPRLVTGLAD